MFSAYLFPPPDLTLTWLLCAVVKHPLHLQTLTVAKQTPLEHHCQLLASGSGAWFGVCLCSCFCTRLSWAPDHLAGCPTSVSAWLIFDLSGYCAPKFPVSDSGQRPPRFINWPLWTVVIDTSTHCTGWGKRMPIHQFTHGAAVSLCRRMNFACLLPFCHR